MQTNTPKLLLFTTLFLLFTQTALISCSKDEAFIDLVGLEDPNATDSENIDNQDSNDEGNGNPVSEDTQDDTPSFDSSEGLKINSTPCGHGLEVLVANESFNISCQIDLNGGVVDLPNNVTLDFDGGEIINGTLNFHGGYISGNLLNHTLSIEGDTELIEDSFLFYPQRWDITQGETTDEKARINRDNLRRAMTLVKSLGVNSFEIDEMDAYFNVHIAISNPKMLAEESILIPENFTLKMSDKTHLRVQPNGSPGYTLMAIYKSSNIHIIGGNLYGDRWKHDYSPVNDIKGRPADSHDWGHVMSVSGGKNILIENITLSNSTGDCFGVHGANIRSADGVHGDINNMSENVTLRNATIKEARRNGMSLLDGEDILIENCNIMDTGQGDNPPGVEYSSAGTLPKYGVSFEAYRERTSTGELLEYNRIEHVVLRGNTFHGNAQGDVVLFTCSNVTLEGNHFDSRVANIASNTITIVDNTFQARKNEDNTPYNYAILLQSKTNEWDGELNYNYNIFNNTIKGYGNAMILAGKDYTISGNTLIDNKNNIGIGDLDGAEFSGNKISSNIEYATGYFTRGSIPKNVSIQNEEINISYRAINLRQVEATSSDPLIFKNCKFINNGGKNNFIENCNNITITNNIINTDFDIYSSNNIIITNNSSN